MMLNQSKLVMKQELQKYHYVMIMLDLLVSTQHHYRIILMPLNH